MHTTPSAEERQQQEDQLNPKAGADRVARVLEFCRSPRTMVAIMAAFNNCPLVRHCVYNLVRNAKLTNLTVGGHRLKPGVYVVADVALRIEDSAGVEVAGRSFDASALVSAWAAMRVSA